MLLRHTLLYLPAQFVGPLFQLLAMIGALLWPTKDTGPSNEKLDTAHKPNGSADHVLSASRH